MNWDLFDASPDVIVVADEHGTIVSVNPQVKTLFDYDPAELVGQKVEILVPEALREQHVRDREQYVRTPVRRAMGEALTLFGRKKNGDLVPVDVSLSPVRQDDQMFVVTAIRDSSRRYEIQQALVAALDVTERQVERRSAELQEEQMFGSALLDAAPAIILVLDHDGMVLRHNRYTEQALGFSYDELHGRNWIQNFVPDRDQRRIRRTLLDAIKGANTTGTINLVLSSRGEERLFQWHNQPLSVGGDGGAVLAIGIDITDQAKAQREMNRLRREADDRGRLAELGALMSEIVHDIGNPLAGMSMHAQLLKREASGKAAPEIIRESAEHVHETSKRLSGMVDELKAFSRAHELELNGVNLTTLIHSLEGFWRPIAEDHQISLSVTLQHNTTEIRADESRLHRVLDNLVKNSFDAIGDPPREVAIRVTSPNDATIRITVSDTGIGIPPGLDIFRMFASTKPKGSGIGLSVSKQIVEAHDGTMDFRSSTHGTEIWIELPVAGPRR